MNSIVLAVSLLLSTDNRQTVVVVVGAPGQAEYATQFETWAGRWASAAGQADAKLVRIGAAAGAESPPATGGDDRDRLRNLLAAESAGSAEPLWLVLIGHGTFDGQEAKFNVHGPDFSAQELAEWLAPCERPLVVVNCASSSGPFIKALSAEGRAIVTAARSGAEQNFARFGDYLSRAIGDLASDLDKDEQVSLLEAFLAASAGVAEFYEQEARLATEHALLDDNGDALATPADWFRGVRATQAAQDGAATDGLRAGQLHLIRSERENRMPPELRNRRDELELHVARLRDRKSGLSEDAYYELLRPLMLELARIYKLADPPREEEGQQP